MTALFAVLFWGAASVAASRPVLSEGEMNYFLVNVVGKRRTKMARKAGPAPQKYSHRLLGGAVRLVRGRHHPLTRKQLWDHWDELKTKSEAGALEVRVGTPMGALFAFDIPDTEPDEPKEINVPESELESKETADAPSEPEVPHDEAEAESDPEVEDPENLPVEDNELEAAPDITAMTNKKLISFILDHSDGWTEKELKKMKKAELLELLS